jgi:hypothetical protein
MKRVPITKPMNPMTNMPKAETFETCLSSFIGGFLATLNTRTHLFIKALDLTKNDILISLIKLENF